FRISAPKSASCEETALPATSCDRSTTRTPSSGQTAAGSNDLCGGLIGGLRQRRRGAQLRRRGRRRKPERSYRAVAPSESGRGKAPAAGGRAGASTVAIEV